MATVGGIPNWPRRMCRITKLALFFWVLAPLRSGEGLALDRPGPVVLYEGEVSISCNASGGGNTTWLVNGVPAEDASDGWEVRGDELAHDNVTAGEHNGSTISCGGVKGLVVVRSVPVISVGPRSAVLNESHDLLLECSVEGGPPLSTRWKKDGAQLVADRAVQLRNSSLLIANASRADAGEYSCEISWSVGHSESLPANVTVQYLRLLLQPANQSVVQTLPGAVIVLRCVAEGVPPPTVSLKKERDPIYVVDGLITMETIVNNTRVIHSPTPDNGGRYTCVAESAFGLVESQPAVVQVIVPLLLEVELSVVELTAHSFLVNWTSRANVAPWSVILSSAVMVVEQDSGRLVESALNLPRNTSSYEVRGLQAFTRYTVQVEVQGTMNAVSASMDVTTRESVPEGPPQNIFVTNVTNTSAICAGPTLSVFMPRAAPAGLRVDGKTSSSAKLKWKGVSTSDLRGKLVHYTVIVRHDNSVLQRLQTNRTSVEVTGLNKFALHHVQVFAETSAGPGPHAFLYLFTEAAEPGDDSSVVNLTATPTGPTSVTVRWSPPMGEVNGNITGYLLAWEGAGEAGNKSLTDKQLGDLSVDVLEYSLTGLRPFTNYSIQVLVVTVIGSGEPGPPAFVLTEESEPSAPLDVLAEVRGSMVQLSWQPPGSPNGVLIQYEYQIVPAANQTNVSANTVNASVTLEFFTNYTVLVWAWTSKGRGPPGNNSFSTEQGPPSAPPSNISVMAERRVATVTWDPPPSEHWRGVITGYRVVLGPGNSSVDVNHTTTQLELGPLSPYTNYSVRVAARTVSEGVFSAPKDFITMPDEIGDAPHNVTLEMRPDNMSLNLSWQPPTEPNGPLQGYQVSWTPYPYNSVPNVANTSQTMFLLQNLKGSTQYQVNVSAVSPVFGIGPSSLPVEEFTSIARPGPVYVTQVLTYATEVQLKWTAPTHPNGPFTGYKVSCLGNSQIDSLGPAVTEHTCEGLSANRTYSIRILAVNKFGAGLAALETVKTACEYQTPQVTGVQFDLPQCGSSPSFRYVLVVVRELRGNAPLRPLNNYTVDELLAVSRPRRQTGSTPASQPYVAANLTNFTNLTSFRLGDGRQYGHFNNTPLKPGAMYDTTLFGERFDGVTVAYAPRTFTVPAAPPGDTDDSIIIYIIAGVSAVLALVLIVIVCVIAYICVSMCRAEKEQDTFGGFTRRSSFRMSLKKPKLVDPLEQFRATHPWPSLESHPPVPLSGFQSRMTVLQADSNFHFIQEYEGVTVPEEETYSTEVALSMVNANKNRYTNIIPYEHSRVKLTPVKGVQGSDYINANYLDGFMRHKAYIATQGPLQRTAEDFWRMVWEQQSSVIVMLTRLMERSKEKCYTYWPEDTGEETYGNIDVRLDEVNELADFNIRSFSLTRAGNQREVRQVKHFQFTAWPDHGVPIYATSMLAFVRRVQAGVQASPDTSGPIIVHCSAGVGRTGTFVVIDSMIRRIKSGIETLDVFGHVSLLRSQRNFMVQTEDQYFFIYEALSEYVTCGNTELGMDDLTEHMEHLGRIVEGEESTYMELEFKHLALEKNDPNRFMSANEPCNKSKNRYVNILPFEGNRVTLETIRGVEGSDYINASFIDSYQVQGAFIATQAPLENTVEHFWRMVWQYKSPIIVMLTQLTEQGVEQCARYWPSDHPVQYGDLQVEPLVGRHTPNYSYREFCLSHSKGTQSNSDHTVRHFHFHDWPEVGVPSTGIPLVELIREVTKMYSQLGSLRPIVVHCSSGVGRTGVFIALNIILERMKLEGVVDVFQTVKMLRIQRPAMVQTLEQYQFCYDTTVEVLSRYDSFKSLLRNTSKARTAPSDVSTFLPAAPSSGASFTGAADDGHPLQSSPPPDELA